MKLPFYTMGLFFLFSLFFPFYNNIAFANENNFDSFQEQTTSEKINFVFQNKIIYATTKEELFSWKEYVPYLKVGNNTYQATLENINLCPFDKIFCALALPTRQNKHRRKYYLKKISERKIEQFLEKLSQEINQDPVDAKFEVIDGKVSSFKISQNGLRLNKEKNLKKIKKIIASSQIPNQINLEIDIIKPKISSSEVDQLGITDLIGEGVSNFRGSTRSRIHNIRTAIQRFQGYLIKPQEEFSFIKVLGEVDGKHGYLPELVIKNNVTKPEFGGGICQVSTTTFRAAIYSGLKITERHPHAYPVHYYNPQGMDATVYIPRPDLRFINNTPGYILIQTKIEGTKLIFQFYGKKDGRKIEVKGPFVTERKPDGSMKTYFTQKVTDKNGNIIINDTFYSNYSSPNRYPYPGQTSIFKHKPKDWSKKQWKEYKKNHHL